MAIQASSRVSSAAGNGKQGHSLISDAKFRQLYARMLKLRMRRTNGKGRGLSGQEAALAAVCADLREDDTVVADSRVSLPDDLFHLEPMAGMQQDIAIRALGVAASDFLCGQGQVTVVFGRLPEELSARVDDLVSRGRLPVIFVEERAEPAGSSRRPTRQEADGNLLPVIPVDSQDVVALYRVAHESIARARTGSGPTRIVCVRRPSNKGKTEDAVVHLEHWLESRGLPSKAWRLEIMAELRRTPEPETASRTFA